jgi:hypothetical protein
MKKEVNARHNAAHEVERSAQNLNLKVFYYASYSAAEISSIVALMLQRNNSLTPEQVRHVLQSTAKDVGPKGPEIMFGAGFADACRNPSRTRAGFGGDTAADRVRVDAICRPYLRRPRKIANCWFSPTLSRR